MNLPAGAPSPKSSSNREKWLSALSLGIGVLMGILVGPFAFFVLYILAIPVGVLVGGIVGGMWGRRTPITVTGFASLSVPLAGLIFALGERLLELPTRAITWFLAPILGVVGLWMLPLLARKLWPEQRARENAAIVASLVFLAMPFGFWQLMPKSQIERDNDSAQVQNRFFFGCDALAEAEGHHAIRHQPPQPAPHILRLRSFPELCCPGIMASMRNQEVGTGDWRIVMHFVTQAHFAETVAYYRALLPGASLREKPLDVPFPCTRIDGNLHGEPVSVVVADVPERGVSVAIF